MKPFATTFHLLLEAFFNYTIWFDATFYISMNAAPTDSTSSINTLLWSGLRTLATKSIQNDQLHFA